MVKAVEANATLDQRGSCCYVERWLAAPLQLPDGTLQERDKGTPQGSVGHAPNAKGNFCFEVTLGYRRVERGR